MKNPSFARQKRRDTPAIFVGMAATASEKKFVELNGDDARAFLARQSTGRIAFSSRDSIDIEPINYSFDNGWILGRTSVGTKLSALVSHPRCAFEVDEIVTRFQWISVVAKGTFYLLDPEAGSPDVYARALAAVRSLDPDAFSAGDPAPHRAILFGIYVNEIRGRSAHTVASESAQ